MLQCNFRWKYFDAITGSHADTCGLWGELLANNNSRNADRSLRLPQNEASNGVSGNTNINVNIAVRMLQRQTLYCYLPCGTYIYKRSGSKFFVHFEREIQ